MAFTKRRYTMKQTRFESLVGNKFFTVEFKKKDNSVRKLTGRLGVKKHVKGILGKGKPKVQGLKDGRVVFKEFNSKGLRSFYPETLISLEADGKTYDSEGNELRSRSTRKVTQETLRV